MIKKRVEWCSHCDVEHEWEGEPVTKCGCGATLVNCAECAKAMTGYSCGGCKDGSEFVEWEDGVKAMEDACRKAGGVVAVYDVIKRYPEITFVDTYCECCETETPSVSGLSQCLVCGHSYGV